MVIAVAFFQLIVALLMTGVSVDADSLQGGRYAPVPVLCPSEPLVRDAVVSWINLKSHNETYLLIEKGIKLGRREIHGV